jgi:single-strand DNA-binding protein
MAGINKVILVGNLGKDPEVFTYENGTKRAVFSLATTESYKDKEGNWQEQTEWHNIVLWRYLAEKNLIKGDKIYLEGKIRSRSWEGEDGQKKYITEIQGDKVLKLNSAGGGGAYNQNAPTPTSIANEPSSTPADNGTTAAGESSQKADDLPF